MKKTPLYDRHLASGANIVAFEGWALPSHYTGIIEEHRCTRTKAGLFDTSHMGEIEIAGPQALDLLQWVMTRDLAGLKKGEMKLSVMTHENGGIIDDVTIYRLGETRYLVVTNAGTKDKDLLWIEENCSRKGFTGATIHDVSAQLAKIDFQGPRALEILQTHTTMDLGVMRRFSAVETPLMDVPALVSRSGYTGEDGFEIYVDGKAAGALWDALLHTGAEYGLKPVGLGARDTLRLEAGYLLYGQDLDDTTTPWEVGYGWLVDGAKDFCGRRALRERQDERNGRKLAGFIMAGRGIARAGYTVQKGREEVGKVTSGTYAPTLERAIGYALIAAPHAKPGSEISIRIRDRLEEAVIVDLPFYRKRQDRPSMIS